ncbi:FeoA domain protein [Peptoniphilus duerdenii ATCC BAA-1640]|uniref:FeoA domain protein n=2 Tax=Peptoniphilaceae TaxID=1570339 RepID=E0NKH7_9FIRM|nr:FeoA domain protein [Peptoniphilus duerdenii ATCC BAA-1640]
MKMNLIQAPIGEEFEIVRIRQKDSEREKEDRHLTNLGFVEGAKITVISETEGNLIIRVKGTRIGIGKDIARKIIVR